MQEDKSIRILVSGKVQHVGFRYSIQKVANQLEIFGFVRNLPNGDVEIEAYGDSEKLEQLEKYCFNGGPPLARVDRIQVTKIPYTEYSDFHIKM